MRRREEGCRAPEEVDERRFGHVVRRSRPAGGAAEEARLVLGTVERDRLAAGDEDDIALLPGARHRAHVGDEADAADHRCRVDRAAVGLVVEGDVARHDGNAEHLARARHALDRLGQLPRDLGLLRVAEVETVGCGKGATSRAGDVAGGLEDRAGARGPCGRRRGAAGAVERDGEPAQRGPEAQNGCVEARPPHRSGPDEVVVALVDGPAAADVRRGEQREELVALGSNRRVLDRRLERARLRLEAVARRVLGEVADGDRAHLLLVVEGAQEAGVRHHADLGAVELPSARRPPRRRRAFRARRSRPSAPGSRR